MLYFHSECKGDNKNPRITIAGQVSKDKEFLEVSFARSSSRDQFSKEKGRSISKDRLDAGQTIASFKLCPKSTTGKQFVVFAKKLCEIYINCPYSFKTAK